MINTPVNTTGLLPEQVIAMNQGLDRIANSDIAQQRNVIMGQQLANKAADDRAARAISFAKANNDRLYKQGKLTLDERVAKTEELYKEAQRKKLTKEAEKLANELAALKTIQDQGADAPLWTKAALEPSVLKPPSPGSEPTPIKTASKVFKDKERTGMLGRITGDTRLDQRIGSALIKKIPTNLTNEQATAWANEAWLRTTQVLLDYAKTKKRDSAAGEQYRKNIISKLGFDPEPR